MSNSWRRFFAHRYDGFMAPVERRALAAVRRALLSQVHGRVLEIGAGTGANLPFYPAGVCPLISEPDSEMRHELRPKLASCPSSVPTPRLIATVAERLPFEDGCFDFVVATLMLCSVEDPRSACEEIRRVLEPGGRLVFMEHVRGNGRRGTCQDHLQPIWSKIGCGCHPNRDTPAILREAGFEFDELHNFDPFEGLSRPVHFLTRIVLPFVWGIAQIREGA
jgi:SAM-dependent methyltransferase